MVNLKDELALDASLLQGIKKPHGEAKFLNQSNAPHHRPPICPYISSTFVDLEEEFKHLHSHVFPQLNSMCQERGSYFLPFDFRRTAVDNRSTADLILKHALDHVNSSMPFFICIIGSHYGAHRSPNSPLLDASSASSISAVVPALSMMDQNLLNACLNYPWVLENDFHTCSMLELEIILACFMPETHFPKHCFFYIQESFNTVQITTETILENESEYAQEQLHDLKAKIINKGLSVKFFSSKEELSEQVLRDWSNVAISLLPSLPIHHIQGDERFLQAQLQEGLIHQLNKNYCKYPNLVTLETELSNHAFSVVTHTRNISSESRSTATYDEDLYSKDEVSLSGYKVGDGIFSTAATFLETLRHHSSPNATPSDQKSILALIGGPGIGKTSLLANWLENFRIDNPDIMVLSEFVGISHQSFDVGVFLRNCIRTLREKYFNVKCTSKELLSDVHSYESLVESFASALQLLPCLIVIDSINDFRISMGQDIGSIKALSWLPKKIPPSCKIIISTRQSDLTYKILQTRSDVMMTWIPPIDLSIRQFIFEKHLGPVAISLLEHELYEKIWNNKLSESPLYLALLANLLISCRSSRERHQVIEKCTHLRNFKEFWKAVFVIWAHRYSWNKNSPGQPGSVRGRNSAIGWVSDVLKLIAASRSGLHRHEILHLLWLLGYRGRATVTPNDWDMFRAATYDVLITGGDGLIRIAHEDTFLAIRSSLFTSGRASARTSRSNIENKQQRYHLLLASYFLKFGSMSRKLLELPWQLQKSNDWLALCQILSKPRFFLEICNSSQWHSSTYIDHRNYWKELNKRDFDVVHCLKAMLESRSDDVENATLEESQGFGKTAQLSAGDGMVKSRQTFLKAPSLIVVTQHDDASVHKSATEDSKSETEDRDYYSETESSSFFITETEVEHHLLVAGWHPSENNPDLPVDDTPLDEDESCILRQKIAWFLYRLGDMFCENAHDVTETTIMHLDNSRPLTTSQLLSLFEAVFVGCQQGFCDDRLVMQRALAIYDDLPLKTMDLSFAKMRGLAVSAADMRLRIAEKLTEENLHEEARSLILQVFEGNKKWKSVFCKAQATRMFGKLLMSLGLFTQSEEMFISAFATFSKWCGRKNIDIAMTLQDLGQLYSVHFIPDRNNQRKAMLAFKQALEIYQFHNMTLKIAEVNNVIGRLLFDEGSLRSKKEAHSCFEHALNVYVTTEPLQKDKITHVTNQYKKVLSDLSSGRFTLGTAKPRDIRTPERPYSALTWHSEKLKVFSDETPSPSTENITVPRSLMRGSPVPRPYSAFSSTSLGGRMLVTPRKLYRQRQSFSAPTSRVSSRGWTSRTASKLGEVPKFERKEEIVPQTEPYGHDPHHGLTAIYPVTQRPSTNEGKEHPVIIVQGEESRGHIQRVPTTHTAELQLPHTFSPLGSAEQRSEISTPKRSVRLHAQPEVIDHPRSAPAKHRCEYISGPEHLCLTVHGPHSRVTDILHAPSSSRSSSRSVDVFHKSAWFHVPGRYTKPGEVLPSKRSQKRPNSATTNSTYYRSHPVSRSMSRQDFDRSQEGTISRRYSTPNVESGVKIKIDMAPSSSSKEVLFVDQ